MPRLLLVASLVLLAACSDVPTQPSLDDAPPVALDRPDQARGASVQHIDLNYSGCEPDPFDPNGEICIEQSGRLVIVENAGGVTSVSVQGARLYAEFYSQGVLVQTQSLTDRVHELIRDGEQVQFSQRLCLELDFGPFGFQFGFRVNVANGEERHFRITTQGCQL